LPRMAASDGLDSTAAARSTRWEYCSSGRHRRQPHGWGPCAPTTPPGAGARAGRTLLPGRWRTLLRTCPQRSAPRPDRPRSLPSTPSRCERQDYDSVDCCGRRCWPPHRHRPTVSPRAATRHGTATAARRNTPPPAHQVQVGAGEAAGSVGAAEAPHPLRQNVVAGRRGGNTVEGVAPGAPRGEATGTAADVGPFGQVGGADRGRWRASGCGFRCAHVVGAALSRKTGDVVRWWLAASRSEHG